MRDSSSSFATARELIAAALSTNGVEVDQPSPFPTRRIVSTVPAEGRRRFLLGVSTLNRQKYLRRFIESFVATFDRSHEWTLVVADDGSTDGTLDYLRSLAIEDCTVVVVENAHVTIAGQTNSILAITLLVAPDVAFKADDDVFFTAKGWDNLYAQASSASGTSHLIYHNREWKTPVHDVNEGPLHSSVPVLDTMGCFFSFTPQLIEEIGYFDERNFPIRGHAHIDWSMRAARAGFNNIDTAWDAAGSEQYIDMWQADDYITLLDWTSPSVGSVTAPEEIRRRMAIINESGRLLVPHVGASGKPTPAGSVAPANPELSDLLHAHRIADVSDHNQ